MVYLIAYDMHRPGQNYAPLHEAIKKCGTWAKPLESTWLVDSGQSPEQIYNQLKPHIDANDNILVITVTRPYFGWLSKEVWAWIDSRVR